MTRRPSLILMYEPSKSPIVIKSPEDLINSPLAKLYSSSGLYELFALLKALDTKPSTSTKKLSKLGSSRILSGLGTGFGKNLLRYVDEAQE